MTNLTYVSKISVIFRKDCGFAGLTNNGGPAVGGGGWCCKLPDKLTLVQPSPNPKGRHLSWVDAR